MRINLYMGMKDSHAVVQYCLDKRGNVLGKNRISTFSYTVEVNTIIAYLLIYLYLNSCWFIIIF